MNTVTDEFLKDTERKPEVDILDQPLNPEEQPPQAEEPKEGEEDEQPQAGEQPEEEDEEEPNKVKPRNRRERRLQRALESEREASRQMAEKLQSVTSAAKDIDDADYLKGVERIYGTDSPEAQMATDLLKNALVGIRKDAEEAAYQRVKAERDAELQAETERQRQLDGFLEEVEDEFGVRLTEKDERAFIGFLEKISPKDKTGKITAYADPITTYEVFKDRRDKVTKKTPDRVKNVANRSLNQGTTPENSKIQDDSAVRFLQENGII